MAVAHYHRWSFARNRDSLASVNTAIVAPCASERCVFLFFFFVAAVYQLSRFTEVTRKRLFSWFASKTTDDLRNQKRHCGEEEELSMEHLVGLILLLTEIRHNVRM